MLVRSAVFEVLFFTPFYLCNAMFLLIKFFCLVGVCEFDKC
ncbi:hypothetical protein [Borreliella garinii]|nr:hypothetical protein [Borreliella garinii]